MHRAGLGFARFQPAQRFRDRHLEYHYLPFGKRRFGDAVACLHDGGVRRGFRRRHARDPPEETPDVDGVRGVVRALIDDLQHVVFADDGRSDLDAARAPAIGQRHFAAAEGNLL
ncbi:hypothetical protein G6F40_016788 [Rhizopus arrhizus]|nr:hypothetical protein G6F40_016788 [Rhizopus arrhizus]